MRDNEIAAMFMSVVLPAMQADDALTGVGLAASNQPRQQGAPSGNYVLFVKLFDRRYGHTQRKDVYTTDDAEFSHEEDQFYETTYQFSAWTKADPADTNALTESDILNLVCGIMQSDTTLAAFRDAGAGVLRITEVRNPIIVDDSDRFAAVPSFDVTLTHNRTAVSTLPAVVTFEANMGRV